MRLPNSCSRSPLRSLLEDGKSWGMFESDFRSGDLSENDLFISSLLKVFLYNHLNDQFYTFEDNFHCMKNDF